VDSAADVLHRLEQLRDGDGRMRSLRRAGTAVARQIRRAERGGSNT